MEQNQCRDKIEDLKSLFSSVNRILILIKKNPSFDGLAAALALYLAIKKTGKDIDIYCETPAIVEQANLVAIDKIKNQIGNKNLIISFDYTEGAIERVSYNIEGNKFNLIIQPKDGAKALSPEKVTYSYSGLSAELVFTIECQKLEDLGKIAEKEREFLEKTSLVNINCQQNGSFAKYNIRVPGVLSCAESVLSLFQPLNLLIDPDIATNLLAGIEYATATFSDPRVDAITFETIAYLLKQGARRQRVPSLKQPIAERREEGTKGEEERETKKQAPPVDWLQPKIYKGGQLL